MANKFKETFHAQGMSCTGCEVIIEDVLKSLDGVHEARASFSKHTVTVTYDPMKTNFGKMRASLKKKGYVLEKDLQPAGNTHNQEKPFTVLQLLGILIVFLALYLIIDHTIGFNFIPEVTSSMGYGVLFIVGLFTSIHCVAMCGGINLSQCISPSGADAGAKGKVMPSLMYNLGRVTSYTVIGGIIGAIGSVISFSGWARGLVAIISGILMVLLGLSMTGLFPWMSKLTPRLPRALRQKADSAGKSKGPYIVGLLNGLMPCGPLQAMQLYALGTGSAIAGALSMFFFSLGTLPLMFGLGAVITLLGSRFTKKMMKVSAVLIAVLGIVMLSRGLALSGVSPSLSTASSPGSSASDEVEISERDGVQNVTTSLSYRGYPSITVKKGVPVVWNLQAEPGTLNGCNYVLVIPEYELQVKLQEGDNIIEFTPTESGTFTYSCWMGMIRSTIQVVDE